MDCYNYHDDAELSKSIIDLTNKFNFKSVASNKRAGENYESINQIIVFDKLLKGLSKFVETTELNKPSVRDIEQLFSQELLELLDQSPPVFVNKQDLAINILIEISVGCFNLHGDAELSKEVLNLTNKLPFIPSETTERIRNCFDSIDDIIKEERKAEVFLQQDGENWSITKEGVRKGSSFIPASSIISVRWGAMVRGDRSSPIYDFLFFFKGIHFSIKFHWSVNQDIKKQEKFNQQFTNAILHYILPGVVGVFQDSFRLNYLSCFSNPIWIE